MKNLITLTIAICSLFIPNYLFGYYIHVDGPDHACPNINDQVYYYTLDCSHNNADIFISFENCLIWVAGGWSSYPYGSTQYIDHDGEGFYFKFTGNSPAIINAEWCTYVLGLLFCVDGSKNVAVGSYGTPTLTGPDRLANCNNDHKVYTANLPSGWSTTGWNMTSHLTYYSPWTGGNTVQIKGTDIYYQGTQTLTGLFLYQEYGHDCGTKNVNKNIWLGKALNTSMRVDGYAYSGYGYSVCPGNHWVEVSWLGADPNTSWRVQPGITYIGGSTQCDFTFPSSGYSNIWIIGNGINGCGPSSDAYFNIIKKTSGCGSLMVQIYPNPANTDLTIETSELNDSTQIQFEVIPDEVLLFDQSGTVLIDEFPKESSISIDTHKIPKGDYFLHVKVGEDIVKKHITIYK